MVNEWREQIRRAQQSKGAPKPARPATKEEAFIEAIVMPAFEEVADYLRQQGRSVVVRHWSDDIRAEAQIVVEYQYCWEFGYSIIMQYHHLYPAAIGSTIDSRGLRVLHEDGRLISPRDPYTYTKHEIIKAVAGKYAGYVGNSDHFS